MGEESGPCSEALTSPYARRESGGARLPRASEEEDDLLDLAAHVTRTSRLACQLTLSADMETLTVRMPGSAYHLDR